jgi:hypothetical protein
MKKLTSLLLLIGLLFIGCEKDDTVSPPTTSSSVFTSGYMKTTPVYFSFAVKDSVASTGNWDLKLTTVFAPDDSLRQFPSPGIVLNSALNVTGTYVDTKFETVDAAAVTGLTKDAVDTIAIDSTRYIKDMPVYYSFDKRDTTSADGNWDIKWTLSVPGPQGEPIIVLNRQKGVTGKVLDGVDFSTVKHATITDLQSDVNDTTLVIGNKCFLYNPTNHTLSPIANRVFVIRTINGARIKFRTLSYYRGGSGYPKFEFVGPEKYSIGSFCLKYDGSTHKLNPYTDRTFVVKTSTGARAKFKMLTYYNEKNVSGYMKLEYEVK